MKRLKPVVMLLEAVFSCDSIDIHTKRNQTVLKRDVT